MKGVLFGNRYILIMLIASTISLLRGFVVAGILNLSSFGSYATIIGIGIFSSLLLSSGKTERTYKMFPRYWSENNHSKIIGQADKTAKLIVIRASIIFMLLLVSFFVQEFRFFSISGLFVLFISLGTTLASLYVSAIRSTSRVTILARNTLIRALLVAVLSIFGSYAYQWQGAIIGEIFGTLLGIILTRFSVIKLIRAENPPTETKIKTSQTLKELNGGQWIFLTLLIISAFAYLDRFFVASVFGSEFVGTFGFLMLFVLASNTFTGIIIQKSGPHLIKMAHLGKSKKAQIKYFLFWLSFILITILVFLIVSIIALSIGPAQNYYLKFNLNIHLLIATSLLALLQFSAFIDYLLMSKDKERLMFYAASIYAAITLIIATLALTFFSFTLSSLIFSLTLSKLFHIGIQTRFYLINDIKG